MLTLPFENNFGARYMFYLPLNDATAKLLPQ